MLYPSDCSNPVLKTVDAPQMRGKAAVNRIRPQNERRHDKNDRNCITRLTLNQSKLTLNCQKRKTKARWWMSRLDRTVDVPFSPVRAPRRGRAREQKSSNHCRT